VGLDRLPGRESIAILLRQAKQKYTQLAIDCVNFRAYLNSGYAAVYNGLIAESNNNLLIGSGYIHLHTERIGFELHTRRKRFFDWSPASGIKYFEVDGTLRQANLTMNPVAVAKKGAMTAAGLVWGPLPPMAIGALTEAAKAGGQKPQCLPGIPELGTMGLEPLDKVHG
jgi:hypothetical protein